MSKEERFPGEPLFAVLDPDRESFFLVSAEDIERPTYPDNPSRQIPSDDRFVQYMPSDEMLFWSEKEIKKAGKIINEALNDLGLTSRELALGAGRKLTADPVGEMECRTKSLASSISGLSRKDLIEAFGDLGEVEEIDPELADQVIKQTLVGALNFSQEAFRHQYRDDYYEINRVGTSRIRGQEVLFSTGIGGGLILGMDASFFGDVNMALSAGEVKFYADLVLEIAIIIGALIGLRVGGPKIAAGIKKALLDTRFMKALLKILKAFKDGTKSLLDSLLLLIELFVNSGLMKTILKAMLTPLALLEALAQLLLLVANPGIALALKWGIIVALGAKLGAKLVEGAPG